MFSSRFYFQQDTDVYEKKKRKNLQVIGISDVQ